MDTKKRYKMTDKDELLIQETRFLGLVDEIAERIEKEFPEFWKGAKPSERQNWVMTSIKKAEVYDFNHSTGDLKTLALLCARLGLDFDTEGKNKQLVNFLKNADGVPMTVRFTQANNYIDYVIYNKTHNYYGRTISRWALRDILAYMPEPEPPLPKL